MTDEKLRAMIGVVLGEHPEWLALPAEVGIDRLFNETMRRLGKPGRAVR